MADGATREVSGQTDAETLSFEESFRRLEETVKRLEEGNLTLDESMALFEEGMRLARICHERLDRAEQRLTILNTGQSA